MQRQVGAIIATAILWAGEIIAITVLLTGTEYGIPALVLLSGGGAANILIVAASRQKTS